jgi:ComF family protein
MFHARWQTILELLYPPTCVVCREPVASDFGLCGGCLRDTPFLSGALCAQCGVPLPGEAEEGDRCDDCLALARPWSRGVAVLSYERFGRKLVLQLKHGDRTDLARPAGKWLANAIRPLCTEKTLCVPVPLNRWRLFRRRYNQSALLAKATASELDIEFCADALIRKRPTSSQDRKSREERFANVRGAISANPACRKSLKGRPIVLVDDVMTSGATLAASADAVLDAGADRVDVAVLARVCVDPFATRYDAG